MHTQAWKVRDSDISGTGNTGTSESGKLCLLGVPQTSGSATRERTLRQF